MQAGLLDLAVVRFLDFGAAEIAGSRESTSEPRNPRHLDRREGGRKRDTVADIFIDKNSLSCT